MKKSIIAVAVLASMAAQAHNTTLYGSVRMGYTYSDSSMGDMIDPATGAPYTNANGDEIYKFNSGDDSSLFGNHGSRFGIKGEDDLGNGMTAFYKYENRIKGNLDTNKLYVGLKGGFGSLSFGKQNLPTDILDDMSDPFNVIDAGLQGATQTLAYANWIGSTSGSYNPGNGTFAFGTEVLGTSSDNSAVYMTPEMGGFQMGVALVADGENGEEHVDGYDIALKYAVNGFYVGLGYNAVETNSVDEATATTFSVGYGNDAFEVGLVAEKYDFETADSNGYGVDVDPTFIRLGALYNFTEADAVYAKASMLDHDISGADDAYEFGLGYQHKLSSRTRVWAEYGHTDLGDGIDDNNTFNLGLRTDF